MKNFFLSLFVVMTSSIFCCTNFLLTKETNEFHAVMIGHTDDGVPGDPRVIYVPAKDYRSLEKRPVFEESLDFPVYAGKLFSPAYDIPGYPSKEPIGYIDQVAHTYAYFQGEYGIMNEHNLAIAEGTCLSKFTFSSDKEHRILSIQELMRLALERCKQAKEAVLLMGSLAEKYGFYGDGESVLIGDTEEGWIFEISSDPEGKSAIWVAKKVPEQEACVITNIFRIQEIDVSDPDSLYSSNLVSIAEKNKWISPDKSSKVFWLRSVSPGESNHPYYSLRRVWRMYQRICPEVVLSPWVEDAYTKAYPFSLKVKKELSGEKILNLFRDHYEGTEFDMTKGLAAGPYGSPLRYYSENEEKNGKEKKGAWERPISYLYTVYSYITMSQKESLGKFWLSIGEPYFSCYMPFYVDGQMPKSMERMNPLQYQENSPWTIFSFVSSWCNAFFYCLSLQEVQKLQHDIETKEWKACLEKEKEAWTIYKKNTKKMKIFLQNFVEKNTQEVLDAWKNLGHQLQVNYQNGWVNIPSQGKKVGYPSWWLEKVGYAQGPVSYEKPKE